MSWGWPINCEGTAAGKLTKANLVNYVDNTNQGQTNGYVCLAKVRLNLNGKLILIWRAKLKLKNLDFIRNCMFQFVVFGRKFDDFVSGI